MTVASCAHLVRPAWIAERWSVSPRLVYRLLESGALASVLIADRTVRVPLEAVEAYERGHFRGVVK